MVDASHSRPTLAVVIVADAPTRRVAVAIAGLREIAEEVMLLVDDRVSPQRRRALEAIAEQAGEITLGVLDAHLRELHGLCSSEWVLLLDGDEVPSAAFLRRLPTLLTDDRCRQWAIRRRWLFPDRRHWIDEVPWAPDFRVRLFRAGAQPSSGVLGADVGTVQPVGYVNEPIYHAGCLVDDQRRRQEKALLRGILRPDAESVGQRPPHRLFEPESFASLPPADVPEEDRPIIARWLPPARGARIVSAEDAAGPDAASPDAVITFLERDLRFYAGERRAVACDVTNTSAVAWPAGGPVCASYHWRWADGRLEEGPRTRFQVDVPPGSTVTLPIAVAAPGFPCHPDLVIDVLEEDVRWFEAKLALRAHVLPPMSLSDRRPALAAQRRPSRRWRRVGRAPALPKVIHQIWLGGGSPPEDHRAYMESWRTHNPRWQLRLWTDQDAPIPPFARRARHVAERADLVRYEILRRHGGVYADTDVECLRPIDALLEGIRVFAGYEIPGRLCNAVMGGIRGHRALERLVDLAEQTVGTGVYPSATATTFLTRVLEPEPEATLFGPEVFYPYLWFEPRPGHSNFPNSYAIHHWAKSWVPDEPSAHVGDEIEQ